MTLTQGDIAIIGYITNGASVDSFSFVNLTPLASGDTIYFTDNGWTGTGFRGVATTDADGNENLIRFTANAAIPAGTVIRSIDTSANFTWTKSGAIGAGGNYADLSFSQSGEQIAAVISTNTTNPLLSGFTALYQIDNTGAFENATNSNQGSAIPGLSQVDDTAVLFNNLSTYAAFNLTTLASGDKTAWLEAINNPAHWTFSNLTELPTGTINLGSADTTPPVVTNLTPIDDATNVAIDANLVLQFDETVQIGTGNIAIKKAADHSVVETIAATSTQVTASTNTVTLNPSVALDPGTDYYIEVDAGAIEDTAGNDFAGISGTTTWNFTTASVPNTPPIVTADPGNTSPFLNLPASATAYVSGVIGDPTDPAKTLGIEFDVSDAETAATDLVVTVASSNDAVVPDANLSLTGTGTDRTLKITPTSPGYSDITVTVTDGNGSTSDYLIKYAASAASGTPTTSRFHTGTSDASTAVAIDSNYMLVADDEDQTIRLYDRNDSGLPLNSFNFTANLGLTDLSGGVPREVDIEASTRVGDRIYWLASHSNSSGGSSRPNRYRLFATDLVGSGASTTLNFVGYYSNLRADLIAWGDANDYNFTSSAAIGNQPEDPALDGFNIEGLTIAPDGTTAYIAFRAPQVPTTDRTQALIAPVTNFGDLVTGAATSATIGTPIEFDLGGRGIRSIDRNANNEYVIIAGPADSATGTAPKDFRLYTWDGNPSNAPQERTADLTALNSGGSFESIVEVPASLTSSSQLSVLVDNGDTVWYGDGTISKSLPQDNHQKFRSDVVTFGATPLRIRDIQGAAHVSPLAGQTVSNIPGIVTALRSNGFYMQDPTSDGSDATSEGVFVFTSSAPTVAVGDSVRVNGTVTEFRPGGSSGTNNLSITQITSPTVTTISIGNPLPVATVLGDGGRTIPTTVIDNDAVGGSVENAATEFDPAQDGIDFYESLEGMYVQVNNAVAVGPTNNFGEIPIVADNGANAGTRTTRGGIVIGPGDFNPERILVDDAIVSSEPQVNVGDTFNGSIVGVVDYSFSNFKLLNTQALPSVTAGGLTPEVTTLQPSTDRLTVSTFNVENLDPADGSDRFNRLASAIVANLKAPDILNLEEVQDNNGATNDSTVDASQTYQALIDAIAAAGGPTYEYRQINPADDQDGGEPGGNIRVGFLFNPSRVSFVDRPGGTAVGNTTVNDVGGVPQLSASPGRIDPTNTAFSNSRKPLVGEFVFNGQTVFVIGNHFNSKGGDQPLFGRFQPPVLASEVQRLQQATAVKDFVEDLLAVDPNANVIVAGDINDFEFSNPVNVLKSAGLNAPIETLPQAERYTYNFEGNAQTLDHLLVSNNLFGKLDRFDVVHINSEFADQISDHDPVMVSLNLPTLPNAITGTPQADTLMGSVGQDIIAGLGSGDRIQGDDGNDTLFGNGGNDRIGGDRGSDRLLGGAGNDTLTGVSETLSDPGVGEADVLVGNLGADVFVLGNSSGAFYVDGGTPAQRNLGRAIVRDFNPTEDRIQLYGSADRYRLVALDNRMQLFYGAVGSPKNELIGLIQGNVSGLNLSSSAFSYIV